MAFIRGRHLLISSRLEGAAFIRVNTVHVFYIFTPFIYGDIPLKLMCKLVRLTTKYERLDNKP